MVERGKLAVTPDVGSKAWVSSSFMVTTGPGFPTNGSICSPKEALYAQRTQQMRTIAKA